MCWHLVGRPACKERALSWARGEMARWLPCHYSRWTSARRFPTRPEPIDEIGCVSSAKELGGMQALVRSGHRLSKNGPSDGEGGPSYSPLSLTPKVPAMGHRFVTLAALCAD